MNKKLTLSINDKAIESAKRYAKAQGLSLSEIVENYLRLVSTKAPKSNVSASVSKLKGVLKLPKQADYKDLLTESLIDKLIR